MCIPLQWNAKGYDIAKTFHKKFTLVSPVWLQVTPKGNNEFEMTGGHDIDKGWAEQVVRGGDNSIGKTGLIVLESQAGQAS